MERLSRREADAGDAGRVDGLGGVLERLEQCGSCGIARDVPAYLAAALARIEHRHGDGGAAGARVGQAHPPNRQAAPEVDETVLLLAAQGDGLRAGDAAPPA